MSDLLERLTAPVPEETRARLNPISWPKGLVPRYEPHAPIGDGPLPRADVVVCTYTYAEGQALADVLSPGHRLENWDRYTENFDSYRSALTFRSPARNAHCLGQFALTKIGNKTVLLFRSELHLATDARSLPLRRLWNQIIHDVKPSVWIDTGTAGGIGADIVEGDAIVADNLRFDCTKMFKGATFARAAYPCTLDTSGIDFSIAEGLMAINAAQLRPEATRNPKVVRGDVLTVDAFLFDDAENTYGLRTYDPAARVEEMDVATLGLVAQDIGAGMPRFTSVRSASDPQMPDLGSVEKEKRQASAIYLRYGYFTQVAALCAVWQIIAAC